MIDGIYSIITAEEVILGFSVFINLGLFINYIDKKFSKKKGGKRNVKKRIKATSRECGKKRVNTF